MTNLEQVLTPSDLRAYVACCQIYEGSGRISHSQLAKALGKSYSMARQQIARLVAAGMLSKPATRMHGALVPVYRMEIYTRARKCRRGKTSSPSC